MSYWILNKMRLKQVSYFEYAAWVQTNDRRIDLTEIGDARVSTEFCGTHQGDGDDPPLLFQTTVRGGPLDGLKWNYATLGEAKQGHHEVVDEVRTADRSS